MNKEIIKKYRVFILALIHAAITIPISSYFFHPLMEDVGVELPALYYLETGANLKEDNLSRVFLAIYAIIACYIFLLILYNCIFYVIENYKKDKVFYNVLFAVCIIGLLFVIMIFPEGYQTSDFGIIYNYAKSLLPMCWHSFLTSTIWLGIFLMCPIEVFVNIVQLIFAVSVLWYFIWNYVKLLVGKRKWLNVILIVLALGLNREMFVLILYFCRNNFYPILVVLWLNTMILDWLKGARLSCKKSVFLCAITIILTAWRGEGILFLALFPIFLIMFYNKNIITKEFITSSFGTIRTKAVIRPLLYVFVFVFVLMLIKIPDKYYAQKYHKNEYAITNTFLPLFNILNDDNVNLQYAGAEEDLNNIDAVYSVDYIKEYAGAVVILQNWSEGRVSRVCLKPDEITDKYMPSYYNIVFHNLSIFVKGQINTFLYTNRLPRIFPYKEQTWVDFNEFLDGLDPEIAKKVYRPTFGYTQAFNKAMEEKTIYHNNATLTRIHDKCISILRAYNDFLNITTPLVKMAIGLITLLMIVICLIKWEWRLLFVLLVQCGFIFAIAMMAPTSIALYYNHSFANLYFAFIVVYLKVIRPMFDFKKRRETK